MPSQLGAGVHQPSGSARGKFGLGGLVPDDVCTCQCVDADVAVAIGAHSRDIGDGLAGDEVVDACEWSSGRTREDCGEP